MQRIFPIKSYDRENMVKSYNPILKYNDQPIINRSILKNNNILFLKDLKVTRVTDESSFNEYLYRNCPDSYILEPTDKEISEGLRDLHISRLKINYQGKQNDTYYTILRKIDTKNMYEIIMEKSRSMFKIDYESFQETSKDLISFKNYNEKKVLVSNNETSYINLIINNLSLLEENKGYLLLYQKDDIYTFNYCMIVKIQDKFFKYNDINVDYFDLNNIMNYTFFDVNSLEFEHNKNHYLKFITEGFYINGIKINLEFRNFGNLNKLVELYQSF